MKLNTTKVFVGSVVVVLLASISGCSKRQKTVLFVSSLRQGSACADSALSGVRSILTERPGVAVQARFTELAADSTQQDSVKRMLRIIRKTKPDVMITYGDDAVKYVVGPHFRNGPFPVLFCGVQWACDQYGLPTETATGMLEIPPIHDIIRMLNPYFHNIHHMAVISRNSAMERRNRKYMDTLLRKIGMRAEYDLLDDFDRWKAAFTRANSEADVIYLSDAVDIAGWDEYEAHEFISRTIQKPVVTCDLSMMHYAVFGITPVSREPGEWAARIALAVLEGKTVSDIPVAVNHRAIACYNPALAQRIEFRPGQDFLSQVHLFE
jgi:ABC-type uncharacterized transport system substrate-binding protein